MTRHCLLRALLVLIVSAPAFAQTTPEEAGFKAKADAYASGSEISRQSNLWVMETRLKPMRLVTVDITDPKTGKKKPTVVWYVVYQGVVRPLARRSNVRDTTPVNTVDPAPGPALFVPEFTIVATDAGKTAVYRDEVLPEAVAAIEKREKRKYSNTAQVVGPIPAETPYDALTENVVEGVATFRGIDPETDFFTLLASGFSNGYEVSDGPDGEPLVWRKTVAQKFWRPGDRFDQREGEFKLRGKADWIYRPDEVADPLVGIEEKSDATDGGLEN